MRPSSALLLKRPRPDRRARSRDSYDNSVTGLVQAILRDPARVAANLEDDLLLGADPRVVLALLSAAEGLTRIRGVEIGTAVAAIRKRILSRVGPDSTLAVAS